ncbi:MAG: class I SAM-dependent methyltransferase [Saprospiraceae bacterium]
MHSTRNSQPKQNTSSLRWRIAQFAEIRWWQNYLKKRDKSEYLSWKRSYWQTFLERTEVNLEIGQRILDMGCGPAGIFTQLADYQVTAVDPLLQQYEDKIPHFQPIDYSNVSFVNQSLEQYVPTLVFPTVFCINAINHVADLDLAFDNLINCTDRNGTLVVSIDAHNYPFLKHIFRLLPGDILHPHQYDLAEYRAMLTQRNCTIEKEILYKKDGIFDYWVLVARKL